MEKRRHYRIPAKALRGMTVRVVDSEGHAALGVLLDVSAAGAGVRLPPDSAVELEARSRSQLLVGTAELDEPVTVDVTMRYRVDDDEGTRYGFEIEEPEAFRRQLPKHFRELFNQRFMMRVSPDPAAPVEVRLTTLYGLVEPPHVTVCDISGIGMSLLLDRVAAAQVAGQRRVSMALDLPSGEFLSLNARIRYRLDLGDHARVGIEFDGRSTEDFLGQQRLIINYILERQRTLAAQPAEAAGDSPRLDQTRPDDL